MAIATTRKMCLFVDRSSRCWVVQDPEGDFWIVPATADAWAHREPFTLTDETELESVPNHYRYMLGLPD